MSAKRKSKEPPADVEETEEMPETVRMGEIPKDTLKENGYVWVASRKLWVKK